MLRRVVLPHPLSPRTATTSLGATSKSMPRKTSICFRSRTNHLLRLRTRTPTKFGSMLLIALALTRPEEVLRCVGGLLDGVILRQQIDVCLNVRGPNVGL